MLALHARGRRSLLTKDHRSVTTVSELRQSHALHAIHNGPLRSQASLSVTYKNPPQSSTTSAPFAKIPSYEAVCSTEACRAFSATVRASLAPNHTAIDPCEDFAAYACGGWYLTHPLAANQPVVSTFSLLRDANVDFLHELLDGPYPGDGGHAGRAAEANRANFDLMQAAYRTCMDEQAIAAARAEPLRAMLRQLPEPEMYRSVAGLTNAVMWLKRLGVDALVKAYVREDDVRPHVMTVFVGGGAYGLPSKGHYDDEGMVAAYSEAIAGMLTLVLGVDDQMAQRFAGHIVGIEAGMAQLQQDFTDQQNDVEDYYNPMPFLQIEGLTPRISLIGLLKAFLPEQHVPDEVVVTAPVYFAQLSGLIDAAGPEGLQAYFQWQVIQKWGLILHDDMNGPLRSLKNTLAGRAVDSTKERWRVCVGVVDDYLGWIDSAFYVQMRYDGLTQRLVEAMIDELKAVYHVRMEEYGWVSPEVKSRVQRKIAKMKANIGFPRSPNVEDPQAVRAHYRGLSISNSSHFTNILTFTSFINNASWAELLRPGDRDSWIMTVPTVNAYYKPTTNSIFIAGGMLQSPFFSADLPSYVSYGGIGAFAGHEMTHAFDVTGSLYDEDGAYGALWDSGTRQQFLARAECFVDQYGRMEAGPGGRRQRVNGRLTLNENVADAGGLAAAHAAWAARHAIDPDPLLPDLGPALADPERLFFVSFAMKWCRNSRPEEQTHALLTDPHSPADKRITGTLANSRAFRGAFNCPVVEPTCELW